MSGSPVAIPLVIVALPLLGIIAVGSVAARAAKSITDERAEAARKRAEEEKRRIREWELLQREQRRKLDEISRIQNEIRTMESILTQVGLNGPTEARDWQSRPPVYSRLGRGKTQQNEELRFQIAAIERMLANLPALFRENPESPYERMMQWHSKLASSLSKPVPPRQEELNALRDTIQKTFKEFGQKEEAAARKREEVYRNLDSLLSDALICTQLATSERNRSQAESIYKDAVALLSQTTILPGQVNHLSKRLEAVRKTITEENMQNANWQVLTDSLIRNLQALGYGLISTFGPRDPAEVSVAVLAVPGGERVLIKVAPDGSLAFQLVHESSESSLQLSPQSVEFFKCQEKRWCGDFRELVRLMTAEGFQYEIKCEEQIPVDRIRVVIIETADEIAKLQEEEEIENFNTEDQLRYMS